MNGVVTNSSDDRNAIFSLYIDLTKRNHEIAASNTKKTMVTLPAKTDIPKIE
jgi:hypothetical protein